MSKAAFKRVENKNVYVQDRLKHKGIFCISDKWIHWAKRYLNRSERRKSKQNIKLNQKNY